MVPEFFAWFHIHIVWTEFGMNVLKAVLIPFLLVDDIEHRLALEVALQLGAEELVDLARSVL